MLLFYHLLNICFSFTIITKKKSQKFSLIHFLIYTAVAFLAVFVFWFIDYPPSALTVFRSLHYYIMSIAAALIYWFWDSICLQK
ncbi:UPF0715 family protein [Bacillus mojavensis]|uniref:UPF0715 family protein n=1 Tax=Bacillus mojavensis TaxID=72360 RepID=UPI00398AECD3